eukprot:TRINITY_DN3910_c0_g1_i1.p1 TRINITY_DN3910_c0_g1~~TRINITY_DN3910_c0_g1_i1.p1  ORF type:complete len:298 (+),score=68.65 TRINITY_DN3910_c0_g1_i1:105-998(+)
MALQGPLRALEEVDDFNAEQDFNPIDPNKTQEQFRNYVNSARQARVERFYYDQHVNQSYDKVMEMRERHLKLNKCEKSVWEMMEYLNTFVDDSDPDTNLSQIHHAFQAAEAARLKYPEHDWLHLTALIHDLGKVLAVTDPNMGLVGDPQWAVVGDTFPVGCRFSDKCVFPQFFVENPDYSHPVYSTELGVYQPHCGLSNVTMSWGHDEYLYEVCVQNGSTLPEAALFCIRFHSFYPWHREGAYTHLINESDQQNLFWLKEFNQFDLYSKADTPPDVEALKPYYLGLIEKYFPPKLRW